jgi:hypothetical protein
MATSTITGDDLAHQIHKRLYYADDGEGSKAEKTRLQT